MPNNHFGSAGASIEHGAAGRLFPVDELDATVLQYRDAQLALDDVDESNVVVVAPTSLASSYFLTRHPLTAIPVDGLSKTVRVGLADALEAPLDTFDLVRIGKCNQNSVNHSLTEFTDA